MEATYRTGNGRLTFKISGEDVKQVFKQISAVQEVFDGETSCGCCQSVNIRFLARKVEDFDFYELACADCHARFSFGQAKKGGALFPKRKDEDGRWLPNRGWSKYQAKGDDTGAASKQNGVPCYSNWKDAQADDSNWGADWVNVAGALYKLVEGNYTLASKLAPATAKVGE